ncbi:MAG: hypothetical protein KAH15_00650 [Candidatus Marinimicrobia bacterium]|nr:hypothetical protein [Candidatus Neomarinimicrobiota bacterium]
MNLILILIGATGVSMYAISTILIYEFHHRRNDKTPSILFINFYIFKFVGKYKKITKSETRRIGPLFYMWIISINIVLLVAILLFVINVIIM